MMFPENILDNRQPQTQTLNLCGVKRHKGLAEALGFDAGAVVRE